MKTATETLRKEHDAILRMLDASDEVANRLQRDEQVAPEVLGGLLEFFQLFADRCHHGKEEDLLFPLLEKKGLPRSGGPLAVMLHEHTLGRALVRQMAQATQEFAAGQPVAGRRWAEAAREYGGLLRAHIQKENNILFVMAERMLSDEEQTGLTEAFEKVEDEKMGPGTHERLHGVMAHILSEVFSEASASR